MNSIYTALYKCISIAPIGMPGYFDVILGLRPGNGASDITIRATCSRFVIGKEYIINIMEKPF